MVKIEKGRRVTLKVDLSVAGGQQLEKSTIEFIQGSGTLLPALEAVLNGLEKGAKRDGVLKAKDAFGNPNMQPIKKMKRTEFPKDAKVEKSLVLIKPDNFKFPNQRPGGVIEVFSRTGLFIIGFKVHRMSVAQAQEFYGPVLPVLEDKLGSEKGRNAWEDICEFMSGGRPSKTSNEQLNAPGSEKCIAIVYQGEDAVRKIRDVLGPTDPAKAPPGSIRKEFGQSIMVNAAHASDSADNARREMAIVQVDENNFKPLIESFYARS